MYTYNLGLSFASVVKENKDKVAIYISDFEKITFSELDSLSNKIANYLRFRKITRGDVIAIQNNKSKYGFATMIACLKLGVIYTNFDYTNPIERIRKIFRTSCPRMCFADRFNLDISELCLEMDVPYLDMDMGFESQIQSMEETLDNESVRLVSANSPAYIMFTSGSTGVPKGVVISHRSLLNFIKWGKETYHLCENDIMTNVNPIYFDNSVFDFYCSVFNGIAMVAIPKDILEQPKEMLRILDEKKCTIWFSVPSMLVYLTNLKLLSKDILKYIRIFSFGGEGYPKELLRKLYGIYSEQAEFFNVYGPTEGTCICSAYKITEEDMLAEGLAPLGQIAPNFDYVILDDDDEHASKGELCLIGDQLALGYYNDIERTQKSFVRYGGQNNYEVRMYRTGDLVELIDEKLYFRGRVDNQIKHMGYRIELEEIEASLIRIEGIKECAVIHTVSKNNFSKIIAYVAIEGDLEKDYLRTELKKYLPQYMIPNDFSILEALPKNANGKIDRNRLKNECAR